MPGGINISEVTIWLTEISAVKPDNGKNFEPAMATATSSQLVYSFSRFEKQERVRQHTPVALEKLDLQQTKRGKLQPPRFVGFLFSLLCQVSTIEVEAELGNHFFFFFTSGKVSYMFNTQRKSVAIHGIPILDQHLILFKPWTLVINFALIH